MTETTPRREATRRRLVEAAIEEFASFGIDATSVEQLCEKAGFTRGAFYSNFASKDELCLAILEYQRDRVVEAVTSTFGQAPVDADMEWVSDVALSRFLQIIAPDEPHRRTLAELHQRAVRNPDFGRTAAVIDGEIHEALCQAVDDLSARLNIGFRVPTPLLLTAMEAVYLYERSAERGFPDPTGLIGPLVQALSYQLDAPAQPDS